ncbi:TolC family protein [Novosphingobium pentaromativorans]|uniref:Outer membrane efflux protein n=1 Tax=Novosphingobium pentaromativorans US6-1 TaxID=1088721 RepID=G6EDK1_9SPHN|nr:TolC family protein [Novosphingobium pentaromativorans]AIT79724.1 transporter [Novosphingobium pentaromativorans US6-1]EHJ60629.1 outer membrane efflux protein [Novosphingobium pentaromativorans US6-1]
MKRLSLLAIALLAGCASYTPQPLSSESVVLSTPVAAVLEKRASAVQRPWLAPVNVDLAAPLTPDAIAAITVTNDPDLVAQRTRAGVSDAQVFAAGLLPDPTFSTGANSVVSGPDSLLDVSGALGFDLNALRTRAVRRTEAQAQARSVRLDLAWAEWQAAGDARLQAVRIEALDRRLALARASQEAAQSLLDRIVRAATRGDLAASRLQAARLAVLNANDTLQTAKKNLAAAQAQLLRRLGLPPGTAVRLADQGVPDAAPPSSIQLFVLARENRPDLAALRQGYAAQEATVHRAVLEQFPNLTLTLNGQRDSAGNMLVGPAVDFTLPLWNRNRGTIAVERATRDALQAEYDARLFQTRSDIAEAEAGITIARQRRAKALAGLDELERQAAASKRAADRGDLSWDTAQSTLQALRDRRMQIVQAEQDLSEQMIALELLTGTPREAWPR